MSKSNVVTPVQPGTFKDQLTEVLREGAHRLLVQAVEAEVSDFLGAHSEPKTGDGHRRVVFLHAGHHPLGLSSDKCVSRKTGGSSKLVFEIGHDYGKAQ